MDFATINTARYVADYTSNGAQHSIMFRYASTGLAAANGPVLAAALQEQLAEFLPDTFSWLAARIYAAGSTTSTPAGAPTLTGGTNSPQKQYRPNFYTFVARSAGGSNYSCKMFGISVAPGAVAGVDFRISSTEDVAIGSAIGVLNAAAGLVGIDGQSLTFYEYANYGVSAYWQRQMRKG